MEVGDAVQTLAAAWAADPQFREGWKANIAMSFVDNVRWRKETLGKRYLSNVDIHSAANDAADYFLRQIEGAK